MSKNDPPPARPSARVTVHPAPLNVLTEIFDRRNIAVGIDSSGQVVLARPDSVLAEVGGPKQRESVAKYVERYDKEQARTIRDDKSQPFVAVRLPGVEREAVNGEHRWTFAAVQRAMQELAALDPPIPSELNHVFLGAQVVKGSPLGSPASWAGEMAFLGNVVETKPDANGVVRKVMLSTAEPAEEPRFLRRRLNIEGRRRPQILVLDTGLQTVVDNGTRRPAHKLLECCELHAAWRDRPANATGPVPIDDEDEPDDDATKTLDFEGGHGTFIAGVIAQLCPDAEVYTSGVLSSFGDGDVADVIAGLRAGLSYSRTGIDIVVMSFGAFFADDDPGLFATSLRRLLAGKLGVAAAGNQATCRPYFPAGMHDVVGVGAVSAAGRAWFSNFGGWVDACAPGVDVVSTFFSFSEDLAMFPDLDDLKPRKFNGWARWSGTSFSAPKVAAVVAQEMYLNLDPDGSNLISAHEAFRRLTAHDHLRVPDLGVAFNA
jgi:subtilisin family serine protease